MYLGTLGELYQATGAEDKTQQALVEAVETVQTLTAKLEDEPLRTTFLKAEPIQRVLIGSS